MWLKWTLIGIFAVAPLLTIWKMGEPRKPLTRSDAVVSVVLNALVILGLLVYWQ